jgi:hypothetical protein
MFIIIVVIVRSKLEYASIVWNSIMQSDSNKLERIQKNLEPFFIIDFFFKM